LCSGTIIPAPRPPCGGYFRGVGEFHIYGNAAQARWSSGSSNIQTNKLKLPWY